MKKLSKIWCLTKSISLQNEVWLISSWPKIEGNELYRCVIKWSCSSHSLSDSTESLNLKTIVVFFLQVIQNCKSALSEICPRNHLRMQIWTCPTTALFTWLGSLRLLPLCWKLWTILKNECARFPKIITPNMQIKLFACPADEFKYNIHSPLSSCFVSNNLLGDFWFFLPVKCFTMFTVLKNCKVVCQKSKVWTKRHYNNLKSWREL